MLCILVEVLSRAQVKRGKSLNDFKFGASVGRFSSEGAASKAVKGLIQAENIPHSTLPVLQLLNLCNQLSQVLVQRPVFSTGAVHVVVL